MKELKATRVPPGDRWAIIDDDKEKVYSSLTEVLNAIFVSTGCGEFYMDAKSGGSPHRRRTSKTRTNKEILFIWRGDIIVFMV